MRAFESKSLVGLGVLLVASLACNVLLAVTLQASFAKLQLSRIFPLGYIGEPMPQPPDAIRSPSVGFWGDSRAHAWAETRPSMYRGSVLNFAHGSQTSSQLLLQLQTTPLVRTDFAVVQIGINDLHPLGALTDAKEQIIERLRANILDIRKLLLERSNIVVMTTIFPPGRIPMMRRYAWDPRTPSYIRDINNVIRDATDDKRVILLDAYALLVDSDAQLAERDSDDDFFLHVNSGAYARLNDQLQQVLARSHK